MSHTSAPGIYVALGANLGCCEMTLRTVLGELGARGDIRVAARSSFYETEPEGGPPGQGKYLNAVAELETTLDPHELLARLQWHEERHGRVRTVACGPRTLDLDLLTYHDQQIESPALTVPHPRMWRRSFVLAPLKEICSPSRWAALAALARRCGQTLREPEERPRVH